MRLSKLFTTLVFVGAFGCGEEAPRTEDTTLSPPPRTIPVTTAAALREEIRATMVSDMMSTRLAMVRGDQIDAPQASARLIEQQARLGRTFRRFLGEGAGQNVTGALERNAQARLELFDAARLGDQARLEVATRNLETTGDQMLHAMRETMPNLDIDALRPRMRALNDELVRGAEARSIGDFTADIAAQDRAFDSLDDFADGIADGIAATRPELMMPPENTPARDLELRQATRSAFLDSAAFNRFDMISALDNQPDRSAVNARLLATQARIGDSVRPFQGDVLGDRLTALLNERITRQDFLVQGAMSADQDRIEQARLDLAANANEIGGLFGGSTLSPSAISSNLDLQAASLLDQTNARLRGDFDADFTASDLSFDQSIGFADTFSGGLSSMTPPG